MLTRAREPVCGGGTAGRDAGGIPGVGPVSVRGGRGGCCQNAVDWAWACCHTEAPPRRAARSRGTGPGRDDATGIGTRHRRNVQCRERRLGIARSAGSQARPALESAADRAEGEEHEDRAGAEEQVVAPVVSPRSLSRWFRQFGLAEVGPVTLAPDRFAWSSVAWVKSAPDSSVPDRLIRLPRAGSPGRRSGRPR